MPRPKPTEEDLKIREARSKEWCDFRRDFLFTQVKLADILGISRRCVQLIEKAKVTPLPQTLRNFAALKARHNEGKVA